MTVKESLSPALLRRWLKVADPTAITAQKSLQRDLSYANKVGGVFRSEVLSLEWEGTHAGARAAVQDLALNTNLVLNPNKHFQELVFGEEALRPRGNVWVLVAEPVAGGDLLRTVNARGLLPFPLSQAHWGTLWELEINASNPSHVAQEMAVTKKRHQGLLGNPHIQRIHVLDEPPKASEIVAKMHRQTAHS